LLQLDEAQVNKDRLYRALDELLVHKRALEVHLSNRYGELFAGQNEVLLYDVTSTYFEGEAAGNALAQRGYSRDHRPDCKQVCIALVVTFDGFPLGYEVFAGNTHDSTTLKEIVETMEQRHGAVGRVWIADRGMASRKNLKWLRETGRRYIIGAPKSELKKCREQLAEPKGWHELRDGVEVKLFDGEEPADISEGAYVLRTNVSDWTDEKLWKAYIQLTQAEAAFRIQKDELRIRPIWHQRADCVQAHILVCCGTGRVARAARCRATEALAPL
jgi:transposase